MVLESLSTDSSGELHVLLHDGHSVGVDCAQVGIFKQTNNVHLSCFLDSKECLGLESELGVNAFANSSNESLEGSFEK